MLNKLYLCLFLCFFSMSLQAKKITEHVLNDIDKHFSNNLILDKVFVISGLEGNYANDFSRILISYLQKKHNISFVDYEIQKDILLEKIKYSEPVFEKSTSPLDKKLVKPDYAFMLKSNLIQEKVLMKNKKTLSVDLKLLDIDTGIIISTYNKTFENKEKPNILYLIIFICLVFIISRVLIFFKNGYNVGFIVIFSMLIIFFSVAWYIY